MLYGLWKWGKERNYNKLCNALAYYHASPEKWNMLPFLIPPGLTNNRFQSLVNGWFSAKQPSLNLGWISVAPVDADTDPNDYDLRFNLLPLEIEWRTRGR